MRFPPAYDSELNARRQAVQDARQHVVMLEAELRGFEAAAAFLMRQPTPDDGDDAPNGEARIKGTWRKILAAVAPYHPRATTLDQFEAIAENLGTPTNRNTLRSQMSLYTNQNIVERVKQGEYRLTQEGADMLGVALGMPSKSEQAEQEGEPTPGPKGEQDQPKDGDDAMNRTRDNPET